MLLNKLQYSKGKGKSVTTYKNTLHKNDWTTEDMFVTLCAGVAIGITIGLCLMVVFII